MVIRLAGIADAETVAAEHPLPRTGDTPEQLLRNYYLSKALLYVRAPMAGITTGWVDGRLAGFIFHCTDLTALGRFARSPGTVVWMAAQAARGRFGYSPGFWLDCLRWGLQHFRQPHGSTEADKPEREVPLVEAWLTMVYTCDRFRQLGVASRLLDATEQHLEQQGAPAVALWTASHNDPARRLYEKMGYRHVAEFDRDGERCCLMMRDLEPVRNSRNRQPRTGPAGSKAVPPAAGGSVCDGR